MRDFRLQPRRPSLMRHGRRNRLFASPLTQLDSGSGRVPLGFLQVAAPGRSCPLVPAGPWLGDLPPTRLLDPVAGAAARSGVAGAGPAALVVRERVLEVRLARMPATRGERASAVADLHQVAEPVAWLVALRLAAMVAVEGRHRVEAHDEPPAVGNGKRPGPVAVRRARLAR